MRRLVISGIVALLIAMIPLALLAQVNAFEGESRATVVGMVQHVGATLAPGVVEPGAEAEDDEESEDVESPDEAPVPELEDPELEPEGETVELPPLNLTDLAEYSSQGVTFTAPADWIVDTDMGETTPFEIEVPGTELLIAMESDAELDFPSWLALALFRSQAESLMTEMGEDAELLESTTFFTAQNLPVAKISFTSVEDDEVVAGTLYVVAPNENAYLVIVTGSEAEWAYAAPGVDLLMESLTFEDDLVTVSVAEGGPLPFTDRDETMEVTVPEGWYVMDTGDSRLPVIVAEPEVRYVAAVGTELLFGEEFDPAILEEFVPEEGELDAETEQELFETIIDMVDSSGSPIFVDEELSALTSREGAITVRLVGEADLQEGFATMPVVLYIDLRRTDAGVVAVFGDTESALAEEAVITEMLESITGL